MFVTHTQYGIPYIFMEFNELVFFSFNNEKNCMISNIASKIVVSKGIRFYKIKNRCTCVLNVINDQKKIQSEKKGPQTSTEKVMIRISAATSCAHLLSSFFSFFFVWSPTNIVNQLTPCVFLLNIFFLFCFTWIKFSVKN